MRLRLRILGQLALVALGALALSRWAHTCAPPPPGAALQRAVAVPPASGRPAAPAPPPLELAAITEAVEVEAGEAPAAAVVQRWAAARGLVLTVDPQALPVRLAFERAAALDAESLREVLDAHDLVLVRGRASTLHLVHRRNLCTRFGPPWDEAGAGEPVDPDRLVTRALTVRHGAAEEIFAAVRGLASRDTNRVGNLLYIRGAEQLVITDFARNVAWYERLIGALDVPAAIP